MGLLCLTPDTTPIPLLLKEHPGWVEGQGAPFSSLFQGPKADAGRQKGGCRCCPGAAPSLMR